MPEKAYNPHTKNHEPKLHWKTERIVDDAEKYMEEQCGWSCYDFLYEEACEIEDEVRCRYANWNETYERYEWWKVDIDECFTADDWEDILEMIFDVADVEVSWYEESKYIGCLKDAERRAQNETHE
jgi:hypothetical protein